MAVAARRPFQPFFRVIKNTKSVHGAEQMIRYVAFRSRDLDDREKGAFDRDYDQADVRGFIKTLPDRLTRHDAAPKAFHCLFSLPRDEFDRLDLKDWRGMVRDVLSTYERETGRRLEWIAANHDNPTHPHCHVIIKAVYEMENGQRRKLWLSKQDLRQFRQITGRHLACQRARVLPLEREASQLLQIEPRFQTPPMLRAYDTMLAGLQEFFREERRRRKEAEWAHQRWLREEDQRER